MASYLDNMLTGEYDPYADSMKQQQAFQQRLSQATDPRAFIATVGSNLGGQLGMGAQRLLGGQTAEEKKAEEQKRILAGLNLNDSKSILEAAKAASDRGNIKLAIALNEMATKVEDREKAAEAAKLPTYKDVGGVLYKIEPGKDPVPVRTILKKGEKLADFNPETNQWTVQTPQGVGTVAVGDNPITAMLSTPDVIPTQLQPLAKQFERTWGNMDEDQQNRNMKILSDAIQTQSRIVDNKSFREAMKASAKASAVLDTQFKQLRLEQAKRDADQAKDGKPLGVGNERTLVDGASSAGTTADLYRKFDASFTGFGSDTIGSFEFQRKKRFGSSSADKDFVGWWQDYQNNVNQIRNKLFGASLTANEKAEFEKSIVTFGMDPEIARENLKKQAVQAYKAWLKIKASKEAQGYSKAAIAALDPGIDPKDLDIVDETNPLLK